MLIRMLGGGVLALLLSIGLTGSASAALYGDFTDPSGTVSFLGVSDTNGLYGSPTVSLNSIDFTPTDYQAECSNCGVDGDVVSDLLTFDIQAVSGQQISQIDVNEGLDYSLLSLDGAGFASTKVTANLFIDVIEVNGASVSGISSNISVLFAPSNNFNVFGQGSDDGIITGTGTIDIQQIIADAGGSGEATRVTVSLDNTLEAYHSGVGGRASIRKRDADFVSITINGGNPVPEPSTVILIGGGLAILARRGTRA